MARKSVEKLAKSRGKMSIDCGQIEQVSLHLSLSAQSRMDGLDYKFALFYFIRLEIFQIANILLTELFNRYFASFTLTQPEL